MPTIALVDDDRNILTSVSIALEAEGYRIMTYTDGASALEGFKTSPPDLAILDIKMPRMDGMETLRRLRQKSDLPVIFLTSKDEEIDEIVSASRWAPTTSSANRSRSAFWWSASRRAAPRGAEGPRRPREGDGRQALERGACAWTRSATPAPGRIEPVTAHRHRIPDPAGARHPPGRGQEPQTR